MLISAFVLSPGISYGNKLEELNQKEKRNGI